MKRYFVNVTPDYDYHGNLNENGYHSPFNYGDEDTYSVVLVGTPREIRKWWGKTYLDPAYDRWFFIGREGTCGVSCPFFHPKQKWAGVEIILQGDCNTVYTLSAAEAAKWAEMPRTYRYHDTRQLRNGDWCGGQWVNNTTDEDFPHRLTAHEEWAYAPALRELRDEVEEKASRGMANDLDWYELHSKWSECPMLARLEVGDETMAEWKRLSETEEWHTEAAEEDL